MFSREQWQPLPRPDTRSVVEVRRCRDHPPAAAAGPEVLQCDADRAHVRFGHRAPSARAVAVSVVGWAKPSQPSSCDLDPVGDGWWSGCFEVPADWQASYRFVEYDGEGEPPWWRRGLRDPGAPEVLDRGNPLWHDAGRGVRSSIVRMPAAHREWLTGSDTEVHRLYDAPDCWWWAAEGDDLPLVIFTDGAAHVRIGTHRILQRAVELGALPPLAAVFVASGPDRSEVLGVPWGRAQWIAEALVRHVAASGLGGRPVTQDRERTVVTGSSFGGLTALFAAARAPERIGVAIAQSVSFWRYPAGALVEPLLAADARRRLRLRLESGVFEGTMAPDARAVVERLVAGGVDATFEARSGGHDWAWWVPSAVDALIGLFGGTGGSTPARTMGE